MGRDDYWPWTVDNKWANTEHRATKDANFGVWVEDVNWPGDD